MATTNHQSPQSTMPALKYKQVNTTTWGAGGNTTTITDTYISTNSVVHVWVTGAVPAAGQWAQAVTNGRCVVTSTNAESSTLPISYVVF